MDIEENFFHEEVVRQWLRLPWAEMESSSQEVFQKHVDVAPGISHLAT